VSLRRLSYQPQSTKSENAKKEKLDFLDENLTIIAPMHVIVRLIYFIKIDINGFKNGCHC
jgi:hypothetical protein